MTDNLKPCPFCGSRPEHAVWSDHNYHRAECEECDYTFDYFHSFDKLAAAWNRRIEPAGSAEPVEINDDKISEFVDVLRSFTKAYPEDIFTPLTEAERKQMGSLLDRASAGMGRHMAKFMGQAADMIERLAIASEQSAGSAGKVGERERLIDFLLGEQAIDGVWFGDKHPEKAGAYWWRELLREHRAALSQAQMAQSGGEEG